MQRRPDRRRIRFPLRLWSASNQTPPGDGDSGRDAHLHYMSVPVCLYVCVRVCDLPLPRCLALVGYVSVCVHGCTERMIRLPLSHRALPCDPPVAFAPCLCLSCRDWPAGLESEGPFLLLPLCSPRLRACARAARPWANSVAACGLVAHMGGPFRGGWEGEGHRRAVHGWIACHV